MLRFLDAGESHGKALTAILEGFPSNFRIDINSVNNELLRRQSGYGRGNRMKIEKDSVEIWSGVRGNYTTGNPLTLIIYNKDYKNWIEKLSKKPDVHERITVPRPGHGDLVGYYKYNTLDIRDTIERTSARETAIRVAVGSICKQALESLGVTIRSKVKSIGGISDVEMDLFNDEDYDIIEQNDLRCFNTDIRNKWKSIIDQCIEQGDTVGGSIFISIKGVPLGIGSYTQWDRKLDGILSKAIISVQGMKAVEFGNGTNISERGSRFNDGIKYLNNSIIRTSNNCGGIEAGISNGENIDITAYMKPIPSVKKGVASIDLIKKQNLISRYERSDTCAVVPAGVVLENVCAYELFKEILNKFTNDDFNQLTKNYRTYCSNQPIKNMEV
ncbi:MAG: aroC [Clostridiaceae bacterium]|jgi:chorismate synthase|nr:aroC [Clostridiaceae bacterium]